MPFIKTLTMQALAAAILLMTALGAAAETYNGRLEILQVDDPERGERHYFLHRPNSELIRLSFPNGVPEELATGNQVHIEGDWLIPAHGDTPKTLRVDRLEILTSLSRQSLDQAEVVPCRSSHESLLGATRPKL